MTAIGTQTWHRQGMKYLESKGWVAFVNIAGHTYVKLDGLTFHDFEAALDHQHHLDEMARDKIRAATPLYHWGKDFAASIDLRRASL